MIAICVRGVSERKKIMYDLFYGIVAGVICTPLAIGLGVLIGYGTGG